MTHASNVCGTVMPMYEVADICKAHKLRLIVDTAQTAGVLDIDAQGIDALAFTGHKGLLAAQWIVGFIIQQEFADEVAPLVRGGTGSLSHEIEQPGFLPDKFESGTMNIPGIIALARAIEYINQTGLQTIRDKETQLADTFIEKISNVNGVTVIGVGDNTDRLAIVSVDFAGRDNAVIADSLDTNYGIMTRCGLHCAPLAHKTLGTYPQGTVRFSFGHFNTLDEVDYIVQSIQEMLKKE
jgi:selenocysteine lyase/cysteine desulfurase